MPGVTAHPPGRPNVVPLELAYKGERSYLHGTDLYDAIIGQLSDRVPGMEAGPLSMAIHQFARRQCDMVYAIGGEQCDKPDNARVSFRIGRRVAGWLCETDRPVLTRRPYHEQDIASACRLSGHGIAITDPLPGRFTPIEVLVAITKRLHTQFVSASAKWAFTRLELPRVLVDGDSEGMQVELSQQLGSRLTKSAIGSKGEPLGHIYFSAVSA